MRLGDAAAQALETVGITKERFSAWVGGPCGCAERQEKLNQFGAWLRMLPRLGAARAKGFLLGIMGAKEAADEPTESGHERVEGGGAGS